MKDFSFGLIQVMVRVVVSEKSRGARTCGGIPFGGDFFLEFTMAKCCKLVLRLHCCFDVLVKRMFQIQCFVLSFELESEPFRLQRRHNTATLSAKAPLPLYDL